MARKPQKERERAENRFDFVKVKQHLKTLPDAKAKIIYLLEEKTEYEQNFSSDSILYWRADEPSFADKCELEIQKLRQQMALDTPTRRQSNIKSEPETDGRNPQFTTARQVLAVHYLLRHIKVQNVDKTEVARFIEFLTGKNYDSIYKKVRGPLKLKDSEAKKDLEFVRKYFLKLGLYEIVKVIDEEIAQCSR